MKALTLILLLTVSTPALAVSPDDYAYGIPLETDGGSALYEAALPNAVYKHSVQPALADVRIFNAAGEAVPFSIRRPDSPEPDTQKRRLSLAMFPVQMSDDPEAGSDRVKIQFSDNGRIKAITSSADQDNDARTFYIIDIQRLKLSIDELIFSIETDRESFVQPVEIDVSNDLQDWHDRAGRGTLARLRHEGQTLERLSVRLVLQQPWNYLRVRLPGEQLITLKDVTAVVQDSDTASSSRSASGISQVQGHMSGSHLWRRHYFDGRADSEANNVFYYDLGAFYPVERINLKFHDMNTLAMAHFESRPDEEAGWQTRKRARVFRMATNGTGFSNDDISIKPRSDRYWRVTLQNAGHIRQAPELFASWRPHRVVFLARGKGPYMLAYGRAADPEPETRDADQPRLLDADLPDNVRPAPARVAGKSQVLGGKQQLQSRQPFLNWRTASLWFVLILAVVMLGYMAMRLYNDINSRSRH